jgi:hypothetical protein
VTGPCVQPGCVAPPGRGGPPACAPPPGSWPRRRARARRCRRCPTPSATARATRGSLAAAPEVDAANIRVSGRKDYRGPPARPASAASVRHRAIASAVAGSARRYAVPRPAPFDLRWSASQSPHGRLARVGHDARRCPTPVASWRLAASVRWIFPALAFVGARGRGRELPTSRDPGSVPVPTRAAALPRARVRRPLSPCTDARARGSFRRTTRPGDGPRSLICT